MGRRSFPYGVGHLGGRRRLKQLIELFRRGVDLIDAGDTASLTRLLAENPAIIHQRVVFEGEGYFENPSLLEFVAENPIRYGRLPPHILEITRALVAAKPEQRSQAPVPIGVDPTP